MKSPFTGKHYPLPKDKVNARSIAMEMITDACVLLDQAQSLITWTGSASVPVLRDQRAECDKVGKAIVAAVEVRDSLDKQNRY